MDTVRQQRAKQANATEKQSEMVTSVTKGKHQVQGCGIMG